MVKAKKAEKRGVLGIKVVVVSIRSFYGKVARDMTGLAFTDRTRVEAD